LLPPKRVRLKLLPNFSIVDVVFSHLSSVDSRRLQVAFNSCTRYVINFRHFNHLSTHKDELLRMPDFTFYDFSVLFYSIASD
jgi:hypothetical protein